MSPPKQPAAKVWLNLEKNALIVNSPSVSWGQDRMTPSAREIKGFFQRFFRVEQTIDAKRSDEGNLSRNLLND